MRNDKTIKILQKYKFCLVLKYVLWKAGDVVLIEKSINVSNVNNNLSVATVDSIDES